MARGYRIELGEIKTHLESHPSIKEAMVLVREDQPGDKRLVAYLVANGLWTPGELNDMLKKYLPGYMIPSTYVALESMPLTATGKVDRKALPIPSAPKGQKALVPGNALERSLHEIWKEVLGTQELGIGDNFFDMGGNSLLLAEVF